MKTEVFDVTCNYEDMYETVAHMQREISGFKLIRILDLRNRRGHTAKIIGVRQTV